MNGGEIRKSNGETGGGFPGPGENFFSGIADSCGF
jgi:hypothetical protein